MTPAQEEALQIVRDFAAELHEVYGWAEETQGAIIQFGLMLKDRAERTNKPLAGQNFFFSHSDTPPKGSVVQFHHARDAGELVERSMPDGANAVRLRQSVLIYLYTLWEDHLRGELARLAAVAKDAIDSPLFGDLRFYRHAIAHNRGILNRTPRVLSYVKEGELVSLSTRQLKALLRETLDEMSRLLLEHFGLTAVVQMDFKVDLGPGEWTDVEPTTKR